MEKVFNIYVNGNLEYQNVSMDEQNAEPGPFLYWLDANGENFQGWTEADVIEFVAEDEPTPAAVIIEAIYRFAQYPEALENFRDYIERHGANWYNKYASTMSGLASELDSFSKMYE